MWTVPPMIIASIHLRSRLRLSAQQPRAAFNRALALTAALTIATLVAIPSPAIDTPTSLPATRPFVPSPMAVAAPTTRPTTRPATRPAPTLAPAVLRLLDDPRTPERERRALALFHGQWDRLEKPSTAERAGVALYRFDLIHPAL